jgi:chromosomal replication initiator protein
VLFHHTISERFGARLVIAASQLLGMVVTEVKCRVSGSSLREHEAKVRTVQSAVRNAEDAGAGSGTRAAIEAVRPMLRWGQGFKHLDDFVVGHCNRLAYDAVMRILEDPSHTINPLFIHGGSGLGKTHLIQGLAKAFHARHPRSKVEYLRCEQFTNDYITACEKGASGLQAFRVRMRHPDLLLIDDLHFLSRGTMTKTKNELFDTFDQLNAQGKKVVITSDAPPADIRYLEDRFIQRFSGGLVVAVDKPDLALRRELLATKARAQQVDLPDEVVAWVAEHITDNVRELEGAVNKLVAHSASFRRSIDMTLARQALGDVIDRARGEPKAQMIMRAVADRYEVSVNDLVGSSRSQRSTAARHVAMYVLKNTSAETYFAIAKVFAQKNHSNVVYACEKVAQLRVADADLDRFIADLIQRVKRG